MVARYPVTSNDTIRMRDAMDRIFGEPLFRSVSIPGRTGGSSLLSVDVFGTENDIFVFACAPGVDPEALEITINENTLTIAGTVANIAKSTEVEGATWFLHEMPHGDFRRTLTLPVDVDEDAVVATFEHGVLRLRLPKAEAAKPRQIKIRSSRAVVREPAIESSIDAH